VVAMHFSVAFVSIIKMKFSALCGVSWQCS